MKNLLEKFSVYGLITIGLLFSFCCFVHVNSSFAQSQFGFNQTSIDASAVVEIVSTTKGLLIPKMTTTQRDAIVSPAQGLLIYNSTDAAFNYYNSGWRTLTYLTWGILGNSSTVAGTHFVGTTNNTGFDTRTNNTLRTRITTKGQIEIYNTGESVFIGEGAGATDDLSTNPSSMASSLPGRKMLSRSRIPSVDR